MNLAIADKSHSFEVTFEASGLNVAMSVYDDSSVAPSLVQGPTAMLNFVGNSYRGKFTPELDKQYLILKAVYTDGTFTTLDSNYGQASESIRGVAPASGDSSTKLVVIGGFDMEATVDTLTDIEVGIIQTDLEIQIEQEII